MKKTILSTLSTIIFCGCSFSQDALYPSLFTPTTTEKTTIKEDTKQQKAPVITPKTEFKPINVAEVKNTGTLVGQKVISFRNELQNIQSNISQNSSDLETIRAAILSNSAQYHTTLAAIESKLQIGTTPGNPDVYAMLNTIQNNIQNMDANSIALEQISRKITADSDLVASLLDSIRSTYLVSGAVDEDHRQLRILENETAQTSILIQSVLAEINTDYARQGQYSQTASNYINDLARAVKVGNFVGTPQNLPTYNTKESAFAAPEYKGVTSAALISINFTNSTPDYSTAVKNSAKEALLRKPNAYFDIVSINSKSPKNANNIFQELINAGVNPSNINLSAISDSSSEVEVKIFVK